MISYQHLTLRKRNSKIRTCRGKHLKENRPDFRDIKSFEEFNRYYWYRNELSQICKSLGLEYRCSKGNKNQSEVITLDTPLLECGFSFNQKFRDYFSEVIGVNSFKFNADMATAWRKVKRDNDIKFTIQDMIKIYYGESDYAKYDNSVCQWNQFLKDFCTDEFSEYYSNKLKAAAILWKEVRDSKNEKIYSRELLKKYEDKIEAYCK